VLSAAFSSHSKPSVTVTATSGVRIMTSCSAAARGSASDMDREMARRAPRACQVRSAHSARPGERMRAAAPHGGHCRGRQPRGARARGRGRARARRRRARRHGRGPCPRRLRVQRRARHLRVRPRSACTVDTPARALARQRGPGGARARMLTSLRERHARTHQARVVLRLCHRAVAVAEERRVHLDAVQLQRRAREHAAGRARLRRQRHRATQRFRLAAPTLAHAASRSLALHARGRRRAAARIRAGQRARSARVVSARAARLHALQTQAFNRPSELLRNQRPQLGAACGRHAAGQRRSRRWGSHRRSRGRTQNELTGGARPPRARQARSPV
jgi:hypothetical protein